MIIKKAANYIRRKVFTSVIDKNGTERLFSVNEEQKEYSAHKRKQNRKIARATQNAEMHANRAAKKADKAAKELMKGNLEQAEALSKSAQKQVRASNIAANQGADVVKRAAKQRSSIATEKGLVIGNQGAGDMKVKASNSSVVMEKTAPKASGANKVRVNTGSTSAPKTVIKDAAGKTKVNTSIVSAKAKATEAAAKAGKFLKKNKKAVIAGTLGAGLIAGGTIAAKKIHDKKKAEKVFSKIEKKEDKKKAAGHAVMGGINGVLAYDLAKHAKKLGGKGTMGKISTIGAVAGTGNAIYHTYKAGKHIKSATKKDK